MNNANYSTNSLYSIYYFPNKDDVFFCYDVSSFLYISNRKFMNTIIYVVNQTKALNVNLLRFCPLSSGFTRQ